MTRSKSQARGLYGQSEPAERQRQQFLDGAIPVAVYGLGKMGLPLAAVYAETTGNVIGVDIDERTVDRINRGDCPVGNEPGLPELVSKTVEDGALRAMTDSDAAAAAASIHVVIVPTTLFEDQTPDLSALQAATEAIGSGLSEGDLVVVESTVPPGTCRGVVRDLLEAESDLTVGDFGIAFCPERTASGRAIADIRGTYPKVIGGIDDESTRVAELVYGQLTENRVIPVSDVTVAECVKVFEGVYRDVNIALANELARIADQIGVDGLEAIEVANTQPYCDILRPGAGVGGHCIPYYPHFLLSVLEGGSPLLETARAVNESMPAFTASMLLDGLADAGIDPEHATVAILGVTYRPGVNETRESPAFGIAERLSAAGVTTVAVDPVLDEFPDIEARPTTIDRLPALDLDGVVLVTDHEAFDSIDWEAFEDLVIVDGRDALEFAETRHTVRTVGRG